MGTHFFSVELSDVERQIAIKGLERLTATERAIMQHLVNARSAKEIAGIRNISERTVITHKTNIKNKLGVHSMREIYRILLALSG